MADKVELFTSIMYSDVCKLHQNNNMSSNPQNTSTQWDQPLIDHMRIPSLNQAPQQCYPQRKPPDRYGF